MKSQINLLVLILSTVSPSLFASDVLPGTDRLTQTGEIDSQMIAGVDRFLLRQIKQSVDARTAKWNRDTSSATAYNESIEPNRRRLKHMLGMRDRRIPFDAPQLVATTEHSSLIAENGAIEIHEIRWPVVGDLSAEGLLLKPKDTEPLANVIVIPDATQSPEQLAVVAPNARVPLARQLAERGCQVIVPVVISRQRNQFEWNGRRVDITNREFLYRPAFELGRHLIGYETEKILACADWFSKAFPNTSMGVAGWGDGGMLALYAAAVDSRIDATLVSGYFNSREEIWNEPIDRNVFGLLSEFGDSELATMLAGRSFFVEAAPGPESSSSGGAGAPYKIVSPQSAMAQSEFDRAIGLVNADVLTSKFQLFQADKPFNAKTVSAFTEALDVVGSNEPTKNAEPLRTVRTLPKTDERMRRQMHEIDRHNQWVLRESPYVRKQFMKDLDTSTLAAYEESSKQYREIFYSDVIGRFDDRMLPANVRTRKAYEHEQWTGYEVVLDVFPDVIAYGLLLIPNDIASGERRPVVVCQHGLEGRPQDVIGEESHHYYKAFAAQLAERGFVTFAPQNLYRHKDRFRTLQRKANAIGKTLFSIITPQHQQIVDWLQNQPFVDPDRIGFYGLSYGGKTAMRVPALVTDYKLSICSADFNEWVGKNASTRNPRSYVWTGEYEIFEYNLGSTFNYAEMAALIAPRPFMVERGHFDGVADDETVGWEFAKVRNLYQGQLKIGDQCEIEWFDGPHTINGKRTFDFLHKHLRWPRR